MTRSSRTGETVGACGLIALLSAQALLACAGAAFREHGPATLAAGGGGHAAAERRAWARPWIRVLPAEVLAGRPIAFTVLGHEAAEESWRLRLGPEAGEPVVLDYRVAGGARLPIEPGERLWFNQSSRGAGLVVRDAEGALRALVSIDGELAEVVEATVTPSFETERLVYSELVASPSGCVVAIDHHALEVRQDGQRSYVAPGSVTRVEVPSPGGVIAMNLYALDVSRPSPRRLEREDPRCPTPAHVSWMVVRAP